MNARFKELAREAYQQAIEASKTAPNICTVGSDFFLALEMEKFAELVVNDCLAVHNCIDADHWTSSGVLDEVERLVKDRFDIK
jgi:hypothetical protein